ncbi:ubiquitin-like small modifier protein 1 [Natronomonas sp. LN261]|uniref:ubiquitin-like small modifier protein 1 n=1 Tax=Natronomonas sp. LN261 TaxID=2750669 RepID=UPI0015EF667F|nr:ubiquitin-like small modifier protein 1 [Natronomonas sp. LN261]
MEWRLFANLAEATGSKRVDVEAGAGDTLGDAFEQLLCEHPDLEAIVLDDEGDLEDHIRLLHDERDPFTAGEGFDTVLGTGDELALFPPVSGGRR